MNPARRLMKAFTSSLLVLIFLAPFSGPTIAHDVRPAYLQIDPLGPDRYTLLWKTPLLSGNPLPVVLSLPDETETLTPPKIQSLPGTLVERRMIHIPGGLDGKRIEFVGLEATITDVLVRVRDGAGRTSTTLVKPSRPWLNIDANRGGIAIAADYLIQGVYHILFGIDHLLFVAALLLIVRGWRMLVKTVTAFTVAHSITLALATLGWVWLPSGPIETLIAASIVFVAVEAVRRTRGQSTFAIQWPWVVAFLFGLLHGFGFAGALGELGLPQGDIPLALLMFNIGVELGQLLFIAVVLLIVAGARKLVFVPKKAALVFSYAIGITASFWTLERLFSVFGQP